MRDTIAARKKRPYDPAAAAALLDRVGYDKRDAQGFRLQPDGKPLTVTLTIFTGNVWREIQTLLKKNMDAVGVRLDFRVGAGCRTSSRRPRKASS